MQYAMIKYFKNQIKGKLFRGKERQSCFYISFELGINFMMVNKANGSCFTRK